MNEVKGRVDMHAGALNDEGTLEHRGHRVWWGRATAANLDAAPLLTVHGGPGICHDCLEPWAALSSDRPILFYDQYGCGRSDRAIDSAEYDIDLFVDELATAREEPAPGNVHLYGHSYGGPLLLEYLIRRRPTGVLSVTLSNTFPSTRSLARGWDRRLDEALQTKAQGKQQSSTNAKKSAAARKAAADKKAAGRTETVQQRKKRVAAAVEAKKAAARREAKSDLADAKKSKEAAAEARADVDVLNDLTEMKKAERKQG